ncbi:YfhO family protein [bacterium]|nr:YfhO family protein [bacterium]
MRVTEPWAAMDDRKRRTIVVVAALALGLPVLFMGPTLLLGRPLIRDDAAQYVYPQFHAYAQALRSGHLYLWDTHQYCGLPALATGQSMGLYPPHLLLFRALPWQCAIHMGYWLHLALALAGFMLVARRLGLSTAAAAPGALLYTYSGYQAAHLVHYNFVAGVAHLPLMVWLLDRALARGRWRDWGLLGLEAALAFLVAHPQVFLISAFACVLWLCLARTSPSSAGGPPARDEGRAGEAACPTRRTARLWGLLAAGAVFLLLIMPQLLPTVEMARLSREAFAHTSITTAEFAESYGYGQLDLIRLILPNLFGTVETSVVGGGPQFHETCAYVGVAGLLLALAGLVLGKGRRGWWFCVAAVALGAVLMWSGNPLYGLTAKLPFVSSFRAMGRWAPMPIFALALLGAMAFESLPTATPERRHGALKLVGLVGGLLTLALLALWVTFGAESGALTLPGHPDRAIPVANMAAAIYNWLVGWEPVVLLAGLVLTCVGLWGRMRPRWRAAVLLVAVGLPLWQFWGLTNHAGPRDYYILRPDIPCVNRVTTLPPALVRPDGWPEKQDLDPVYGWRDLLTPALGTVFGASYAEGYKQGLVTPSTLRMWTEYIRYGTQAFTGVVDTTAETIERVGTPAERMKRFHRLCGVASIVTPGRISDPDLVLVKDGPVRVYHYGDDRRLAWLVGTTIVVPEPEEQLQTVKLRSFDPMKQVVLDRDVPGVGQELPFMSADVYGPQGDFSTTSPLPAVLVVSQAWYPGWRASVDGKPAPLLRANYAFCAVPVPAGQHHVRLVFAPPLWRLGLLLALAGLIVFVLLVWRGAPRGDEGGAR